MESSPLSDIPARIAASRAFFASGATLPPQARLAALDSLEACLREREDAVFDALRVDLGKDSAETYMSELGLVYAEISHARRNLKRWMRPRRVKTPLFLFPASSFIHPSPLGLVLIFSPWNYPIHLCLLPLVAALAAGNCAVLKPSQSASAAAAVLRDIVEAAFPPDLVWLVNAGHEAASALLAERFDFIFYTGSTRVGRLVMENAARHLTPVCLEMGGKSPAIVAADADIRLAARRIAWGKGLNAGQTCIAPDYVWADERIRDELLDALNAAFTAMYGEDPPHNPAYGRIINRQAFSRLHDLAPGLLRSDEQTLRIAPLALKAFPGDPVMQEEIFGPLLPVLSYRDPDEALDHVKAGEKPLALYLFTRDKALERRVLTEVPFGGGCVNDVVVQISSPFLPFGGVGASGMGRYHGQSGFDLLSNRKGVVHQSPRFDFPLRYPPFKLRLLPLLRKIMGPALVTSNLLFAVPAPAEPLEYGKTPLQVQNPVGFVDSSSISPRLFERTRDNAELNGVLLKVYLPDDIAQYYSDGRPDALTRQICLYGVNDAEKWSFDRKALDLMAKTLEGSFAGYEAVPDEARRNRAVLDQTMREAVEKGTPLLVQTLYGDNHVTYLTLLSYPLEEDLHLSQAMSTTLVLVGDSIVFINASSLIQTDAVAEHMLWARSASESFVDMLASANKS